jgi:hypothetical protein
MPLGTWESKESFEWQAMMDLWTAREIPMEDTLLDDALVNFADDADDETDIHASTERYHDAVLYGTDWTVRTLLQQIEQGNIDLSPSFQRRDAWTRRNKSRFIESVALQLPIPQIVLAERKEQRGTYIVLDGKQRLLTLAQFAGNFSTDNPLWQASVTAGPLRLIGLTVLAELNSKTYTDIADSATLSQIRTQFDNHTIRSALIRNWPDEDYLYEVFIRLNTGSARLSPQELRQAMKPGPFTEFLGLRSANSEILQKILGITAPDFRMRDVDLLLRLIAFLTRLPTYKGNLKPFLDETHDYYNRRWDTEETGINATVSQIESGLSFLADCFGNFRAVGRRWDGDRFDGPVNRAVLDVQLASALDPSVRSAVEAKTLDLKATFIEMSRDNPEFSEAISGTTKSIVSIRNRYTCWQRALEDKIGTAVRMPALPNA